MPTLSEFILMCELRAACGEVHSAGLIHRGMTLDELVERGAEVLQAHEMKIERGLVPYLSLPDWVKHYEEIILHILEKHYDT